MKKFDEAKTRKTMRQLGFEPADIGKAVVKAEAHCHEYNERLKVVINELDGVAESVRGTYQDCGARSRAEEIRMSDSENRRY